MPMQATAQAEIAAARAAADDAAQSLEMAERDARRHQMAAIRAAGKLGEATQRWV